MKTRLVVPCVATAFLAACGARPSDASLGRWQEPSVPAKGISARLVLASGALVYNVAIADTAASNLEALETILVSVELTTAFELVVRSWPESSSKSERRIELSPATYDINALAVGSKSIFVASSAGWVRQYARNSLTLGNEWRFGSAVTALAVTQDNKYLLIGTEAGVVCLRRLRDGAQLQCMVAHNARVADLEISGNTLASASWAGDWATWEIPSLRKLSAHAATGLSSIAALAFSGDGKMLAVARNASSPVRSPEIARAEKKSPRTAKLGANIIAIYPMSKGVAGQPILRLEGHHSVITSIVWSGLDLISGSWDRSAIVWNIRAGGRIQVKLGGFAHLIHDLAASALGGRLAIASWGPTADDVALSWVRLQYTSTLPDSAQSAQSVQSVP